MCKFIDILDKVNPEHRVRFVGWSSDFIENETWPSVLDFRVYKTFTDANGIVNVILTEGDDVIDTYKKQDYGGRWRNTVTVPAGLENTPEIIKNYKFNYCAENTSNKYYITEKIVNAFLGNSIPIYWGGEANLIFNEGSFINLNNKSDEEIVEIIKEIDTDKNKYKQMFETPLLKDPQFFEKQRNNIEQFLVTNINKVL